MKSKSGISGFFSTGLLLVPGFLYAFFSLLLSSNRLFPDKSAQSLLLLNTAQLLSFGVTIGKYASDQMILSKLQPGEHTGLKIFFLKRVLPLSFLFSTALYFTNGLHAALTLAICIPVEIFAIITILELNISKKYFKALGLSLIGYPMVFSTYILLCVFFEAGDDTIFCIFIFAAIVKMISAFFLRHTQQYRNDILVTSAQVPFQQVGNYLLFRSDQLIIASNILQLPFFNLIIPGDYLFYSKMTELFSGISTSLSPVLSTFKRKNSEEISVIPLLRNRFFIGTNLLAITIQTFAYLFFVEERDVLHVMMCIPFTMITILIIPVNMINYELYRTNSLKESNIMNLTALLISLLIFAVNLILQSPLIFAFTIPVQLISFIVLNKLRRKNITDV